MSLKHKVIVITGGTGGIGRAIVKNMIAEGATVYFTYSKDREAAEEMVREYTNCGAWIRGFQVDVRNYEACQEFIETVIKESGTIDVLINNAGICMDRSLPFMNEKEWDEVLDTNLTGTFHMTKHSIFYMLKQRKGRIINMSSVSGLQGIKGQTNYSASKAGIIGFTKALAKEIGGYGITVNAVAPGAVETKMLDSLHPDYVKKLIREVPLKRLCEAKEVAMTVRFLADTELSPTFLTGQVITLDGGKGD